MLRKWHYEHRPLIKESAHSGFDILDQQSLEDSLEYEYMQLISLPRCLQSVHKWSYCHLRHLDMNCSDRCGVQQERALLAGILLVDSCLCETEKVRHIDGEERHLIAVS